MKGDYVAELTEAQEKLKAKTGTPAEFAANARNQLVIVGNKRMQSRIKSDIEKYQRLWDWVGPKSVGRISLAEAKRERRRKRNLKNA